MPPEPTSPATLQFLRHSPRPNTSSLREQKQSKQRANNRCIFNGLQMHNSVNLLDSYSYKLGGRGGVFFQASLTSPRVSANSASLRYPFSRLRLSLFNCRLSTSRLSPLPVAPAIDSLLHCFSHGGSHPEQFRHPQPAGRTHSAVPRFSVSLTNHKTKASKSCSRN